MLFFVQHMWSLTTVVVAVLMVCLELDNKVGFDSVWTLTTMLIPTACVSGY